MRYPYGSYRTDDDFLLFGLDPWLTENKNPNANSIGGKDMVLGVRLNGLPKAYPFDSMASRSVINDQIDDVDLVVLWDEATQLAIPYARYADNRQLTFDIDDDSGFPFNMRDRETGSLWNIKGIAIEGELAGHRLTQIPAHNSFWFAWVTFFEETEVWGL